VEVEPARETVIVPKFNFNTESAPEVGVEFDLAIADLDVESAAPLDGRALDDRREDRI